MLPLFLLISLTRAYFDDDYEEDFERYGGYMPDKMDDNRYDEIQRYKNRYYYDDNDARLIVDLDIFTSKHSVIFDNSINYEEISQRMNSKAKNETENVDFREIKRSDDIGSEIVIKTETNIIRKENLNSEIESLMIQSKVNPTPPPHLVSTQSKPLSGKYKNNSSIPYYYRPKDFESIEYRDNYADMLYDYVEEEIEKFDLKFDDDLERMKNQFIRPVYTIERIVPDSISSKGNLDIKLKIKPKAVGEIFCKFGNKIVKGWMDRESYATCKAPPHKPALIAVFFSKDYYNWYGPVELKYGFPQGLESMIIFLPILFIFILVSLISLLFFYLYQNGYLMFRSDKSNKRSNRRSVP